MADTYTAHLVGGTTDETIELELIGGLPQKSIVRSSPDGDVVWELVDGGGTTSDHYEYQLEGIPEQDY
jgi:hypothetical protein